MDEIIEYIMLNQLDKKGRHRQHAYRRYYLYNLLRNQGIPYASIGDMFNRDHASIMHGIKVHKNYTSINDNMYDFYTMEEQLKFTGFTIERSLVQDILSCTNMDQLKLIQFKLKNNQYKVHPDTTNEVS
jgi:hypothetical protein